MRLRTFSLALIGCLLALSYADGQASAPEYEANPKWVAAMAQARQLKEQHQFGFAVDAYLKANKIAGGGCSKCLSEAFDLQFGLGRFKDAAGFAQQMEALAKTPMEKSIAEGDRGLALMKLGGDKPKPAQLDAAHAELQAALTDYPKNLSARYSDACVLARMGKTDEAREQFSACAKAASPKDPMRTRAEHFAENPALSMAKMAPAFTVKALDGSKFTLDDMGGRVVLIDFWATWCGPCNEELPHMKKIAKEFANEPLVIISISWDDDAAKWKDFIAKNEMTWVQYRDGDHKLSEMFNVDAIPHYFTIDSDGVLTTEMVGSGSDVEGKLKKLLKRAHEAKPSPTQVAAIQ
jgi:thiol-disulfide isomerase/thioredoxin